jgi:hypothetical protein
MDKSGKTLRLFASVVILTLSVFLVYRAARPRPVSDTHAPRPSKWGLPKSHMKTLLQVPMIEGTDHAGYTEVMDRSIEPPLNDDASRLTDETRRSLVDLLSTYLDALTASTPDKYMAIADSEPTEWIGPTDHVWETVDYAYDYFYHKPADRHNPRGVLRDLLLAQRFTDGHRYARIGTGKHGMRILVGFARVAGDMDVSLIAMRDGYDEGEYWVKGGAHGIRFREPARSPDDIIKEYNGVVYAQSSVVLVTEEGRPAVWHGIWYWDPGSRRWLNRRYWGEGYHSSSNVTLY